MKKTIIDLFEASVDKYGGKTFLLEKRHHKFEPTTYAETRELALEVGAGLVSVGIRPGDKVAILAEGSNAWIISELGLFYAGAVSVPIGDAVGWRGSLLVWAVLVAVVLLMWVPHRDAGIEEGVPEAGSRRSLLSSPTTWFIALYLGLQSLIYYAMVAWMAVILQSKGLDPSEAGVVVSVYMVVGIAGSILLPAITGIRRDLRAVGASLGAMYIVGLALLQLSSGSPASLAAPVLLCGLCGGACITYPSMLFGLRTRTSGDSSSVSGIAQSVGYLVAAVGPVAVGAMHDAASDWGPGILFLICVAASLVVLGYLIGRDVVIGAPEA